MNRILIVYTSWYEKHIAKMLDISVGILEKSYKCDKAKAPGAIELSALAKNKLEKNKYVGVLFLGIIIRGETSHYDLVSTETFRSIGTLADQHHNIALINNVICVENQSQLKERLAVSYTHLTLPTTPYV